MNRMLLYLVYLLIISIIFGPLGKIPLDSPQISMYFTDIFVGLICLIWIIKIKTAIKLIRADKIAVYFCLFTAVAIISLIFSPVGLNLGEKIISALYLVRFIAYFFVYLSIRYLLGSSTIGGGLGLATPEVFLRLLTSVGLILAVLGWIQYALYPDLRNLYYLGWDPHFRRIFATYLDPNFFGLMLVLSLIVTVFNVKKSFWSVLQSFLLFVTLMFTYSRSSFLALVGAIIYYFAVRKRFIFLVVFLCVFFISVVLLPRPGGVGVQLERIFSIESRLQNWQEAYKIILEHPVLGVGFNALRYAKIEYSLNQDNLTVNHAGAGFDNSFLFIAATTGLTGLFLYMMFLGKICRDSPLWVKTSILAIVIHSLFVNSLFFPWVMVWLWILAAFTV